MLNRMRNGLIVFLAAVLTAVGCDERNDTVVAGESPAPATAPTSMPASSTFKADEPLKQIALAVIPFTGMVPESWAVQSGLASRIVLHGVLASGEIDVLLSNRQALNPDDFKSFVTTQRRPATQPTKATVKVITRDGMTIVETVDSPIPGLVTYNVKYLVAGPTLDYQVYELNIGDLTQEMYDADGERIREVLLNLRYDPKAMGQTP